MVGYVGNEPFIWQHWMERGLPGSWRACRVQAGIKKPSGFKFHNTLACSGCVHPTTVDSFNDVIEGVTPLDQVPTIWGHLTHPDHTPAMVQFLDARGLLPPPPRCPVHPLNVMDVTFHGILGGVDVVPEYRCRLYGLGADGRYA